MKRRTVRENPNGRVLTDVFLTMSFLFLVIMYQSVILPEKVEIQEQDNREPSSFDWTLTTDNNGVQLNGEHYSTIEAALGKIADGDTLNVNVGSTMLGSETLDIMRKVKALGITNAYLSSGETL